MPNILVRGVSEPIAEALKRQAARNRRSLQREVLVILERAVREPELDRREVRNRAAAIRERLAQSGRPFSNSVDLIREDRDR